jgi:polyhydroxyalkanoate synthesis regulator phasin
MKKLLTIFAVAVIAALCIGVSSSYAGEIDMLLQKLVEKGVLTAGEAQQVGTETKEQVKAEIAEGKFSSLPAWVQNTKLKGDLRVRYQSERKKTSSSVQGDKERGRIRMRLGVESKVNAVTKAHIGIATGSSTDNRSTNQTFDDSFEKKSIWLDYAYIEYMASPWATVMAGRMKNPIWQTGDMLWDTDINPEGGAVTLTRTIKPEVFDLFLTSGFFVLEDSEDATADSTMVAVQPGFSWKITPKTKLKLAGTLYEFNSVQGNSQLSDSQSTNTLIGPSHYKYDYDSLAASSELSFLEPMLINKYIPYLAVFGDFVNNPDPEEQGWLVGVKFGKEKVSDWKDWQFKYQRRRVDTDAWLDSFPDSDVLSGATRVHSDEYILSFGLNKNATLDFDLYNSDVNNGTKAPQRLYQVDLNFKF